MSLSLYIRWRNKIYLFIYLSHEPGGDCNAAWLVILQFETIVKCRS